MIRRITVLLVVGLLAWLVAAPAWLVAAPAWLVAAPAWAHPISHPGGPRITNLRPAPGIVLPGGQPVEIAVLVASDRTVPTWRMRVDGVDVDAVSSGGAHPTLAVTVDLMAGDHIVNVVATDSAGISNERAWRFTVGAVTTERLAGPNRIATAIEVSRDLYGDGEAEAAVLARADDFPDALAGVPLAAVVDGPLLLTEGDGLHPATALELQRILPETATVQLLGGTAALSAAVESDVEALGFDVARRSGSSRYATAAALADVLPESTTAFVVSGEAFADALAASSPAGERQWPILLTRPGTLPDETRGHLVERGFERVLVVGGSGAVSDAVVQDLQTVVSEVTRLSGATRYETAAAVAEALFGSEEAVAVANGERFPDALAGGRHAAARGIPLLLTQAHQLPGPTAAAVGAFRPATVVLYGGAAVVAAEIGAALDVAVADAGGPAVAQLTPPPGTLVNTLDQVVISFDHQISPPDSSIYVSIGGQEVPGTVTIGDFPTTLVFQAQEVPGVSAGVEYPVRVTAAAYDGASWRHVDYRFSYKKVDLARGDAGPLVVDLQNRLVAAGYWVGPVDGVYGTLTHQAVMALQKVHGLQRDGVYGPATRAVLESNPPRPTPRSSGGLVMEVDKPRQVLLMVRNGQVEWIFNTSTGTEQPYVYEGETYLADTPPGHWTITRQIDGIREGNLGVLYRPKYFHPDGIAIHGSSSVPAYPASHGCVRVTNAAIDWLWDRVPLGTAVWVY